MIELLAPAGNMQNLIQAVSSGADAVYLGLKNFSARAQADNFDYDELKYSIAYAKTFGVKVYITVNTLIKTDEIDDFISDIKKAYCMGADAFILQDIFLGKLLKKYIPDIVLHLSTQAGVCNVYGAEMAKKYGFSRVILARETKFDDIKKISQIIETEVFVQGALCTAFSGHCYFSSFVGGNSGNRGSCKQPCRKLYSYEQDGVSLKKGFNLSLSDLCLINRIEDLKKAGVKSLKIEGRMRSEEYVAVSVQFYKSALNGKYRADLYKALQSVYNRGDYTEGLAFTQKDNFISDKIQNHKGLRVGSIGKIYGDKFLFKDYYNYTNGDCFKILRNNREIGNAICTIENGKTVLKFKGNVCVGDDVNITKDVSLIDKYLLKPTKKDIYVKVKAVVGEKLTLSCSGVTVYSQNVLEMAKSSPSSKESIIANLNKTDKYPFNVNIEDIEIEGNPFILNSVLNNLRAKLYYELFYVKYFKFIDNTAKNKDYSIVCLDEKIDKLAIIVNTEINISNSVTDIIIAPQNYNNYKTLIDFYKNKNVKNWLYLPPYLSSDDLKIVDNSINDFDGVYGDGYWCLEYATKNKLDFFAGVGFNVFNSYNVYELQNLGVKNICLSKELKSNEINKFNFKPYVLSRGSIELMDLIYCPFSKRCNDCKIKNQFILQDSDKREFPVLRYKTTECRFKVFNCAQILYDFKNVNKLYDLRCLSQSDINLVTSSKSIEELKTLIKNYTNGNYVRGVE